MFFFFLDYKNFGRVRISDVVVSGFLENIFIHQNTDNGGETHYENWYFNLVLTLKIYDVKVFSRENTRVAFYFSYVG